MIFQSDEQIREMMDYTCRVCSIISTLRKQHNLPNKLRLPEAQVQIVIASGDRKDSGEVLSKDLLFLFKDYREIISNESNIEWVEPFFSPEKHEEDYILKSEGNISVKLNINYTPGSWDDYLKRKKYSEKMMEEKKNGLYDENTYKKYEHLKA